MTGVVTLLVDTTDADMRLDRWFRHRFPQVGHGRLEKLLRTGQIRVDGKRAKAGQRLGPGQTVRVPPLPDDAETRAPPARPAPPTEAEATAVRDLVLYRDDMVIALDKPAGWAVQGGPKTGRHLDGLLDALRFGASERPRLVHRLDRDTSGVLVLARTAAAARALTASFRSKDAQKEYWAAVVGVPHPERGRLDLPLEKCPGPRGEMVRAGTDGGKPATTLYAMVDRAGSRAAWLAMWPLTGRTHQLRVHAVALGVPILGDRKYGGSGAMLPGAEVDPRMHLHARRLVVPRPGGGVLDIVAPLPRAMAETWAYFGFDPAAPIPDPFADQR